MNETIREGEAFRNFPVMNVSQAMTLLGNAYSNLIRNGIPLKSFPSVMLWGAPGVGKSQGVREMGELIQKNTGKKVVITDVRLILFNPVDLRGIPVANPERTLAVWLKPKIFEMDPSPDVINILFLDEISACPPSLQASAYQLTLDRKVGEHELPENCLVIAAGNRVTDKAAAYKMSKALANRLLHVEIDSDFASWKRWAVEKDIDDRVIAFLGFKEDMLSHFDPKSDDLAFPSPRSWEMVSNVLSESGLSLKEAVPLISGLVGQATTNQFVAYCAIYKDLPSAADIFAGESMKLPTTAAGFFAVIASLIHHAKSNPKDLAGLGNSLAYASQQGFPRDFAAKLIDDYSSLGEDFAKRMKSLDEYWVFVRAKGVRK